MYTVAMSFESPSSPKNGILSSFERFLGRRGRQAVSALALASALDAAVLPTVADAALTKDPIVATDSELKSPLTGLHQSLHAPTPKERLMKAMVQIQRYKAECAKIPESRIDDALRSRLASLDAMSIDKYREAYSRGFGLMTFVSAEVSDEKILETVTTLEEIVQLLAHDVHACERLLE